MILFYNIDGVKYPALKEMCDGLKQTTHQSIENDLDMNLLVYPHDQNNNAVLFKMEFSEEIMSHQETDVLVTTTAKFLSEKYNVEIDDLHVCFMIAPTKVN